MKPTKFTSLLDLTAAIATERAKPGSYRAAILAGIATEAAVIARLEQSLDPATIDALATSQARHAALTARLDAFDQIALANRETQILDGFCRENCEEIAGLLDGERANRSKPSTGYFTKMADRFTTVARKFFGTENSQEDLRLAGIESEKIQAESDRKTYELATASNTLARFKLAPSWETYNDASLAVNALNFPCNFGRGQGLANSHGSGGPARS
ncbi:MAG: hypothetical protein WCP45_05300 [Verrucomicrobiota bacterium]